MKNKISFLALFAIALNVNHVCASECVDDDCELTPVEITEEVETVEMLIPVEYEYDWSVSTPTNVEITEGMCEYDYNCPFKTPEECAIWYTKPAYKTTVAPRAPHINSMLVDDMAFALYANDEVSANDPEMSPLVERYNKLMKASDACCTSGIIYKMRQNGASDEAVYEFLKDDANNFALTKRCLVMSDAEIESRYSNGVTGKMVAEVRNLCLCKNHQWFDSLLQPFVDMYERAPEFRTADFLYSYMDGMNRDIEVSVNEDVQNAMDILAICPK